MRRPTLRVQEIAKEQGISMTKLQHRAELAQQTVRALWYDKANHDPQLSTLQRVADVLEVSVCDLLGPPQETYTGP
jgi:DNA-binding Xre family transcriptional regulator